MKNMRRLAVSTLFLIFVFMVIALFQYQTGDDTEHLLLPEHLEYFFNEDWSVATLDNKTLSESDQSSPDKILELAAGLAEEEFQTVTLPYAGKSGSGDTVLFKNTLPQAYAGMTLSFSSTDTAVRVILDGKVIYEHGFQDDGTLKKPSGYTDHAVSIPDVFQNSEILILLTSPYPDTAARLESIKLEHRGTFMVNVIGNSVGDIGCCVIIIIMAFIMFVLALIRLYTHQPARGEIYLGLTGLAAGLYYFIGTDTLSIFYSLQKPYVLQEYLLLLIPLFLSLYFERNLHTVYPRRFSALLLGASLHAAAQILLHLLGIRTMEDMSYLSAGAVSIVCTAAIVSLIQYDYSKKQYQTLLSVLSMLVLLSGCIANVIMHAVLHDAGNNAAGQYSMALFSVMMAVMHVFQISKEYRANAEENARLLTEKVKAAEQQNIQLALAKKDADAARHEALAANDAKGRFLAHMSHEIRTPINAVLGMDEMILRESKEPAVREYAMDIYTAGQTLLSLINDILDFSRIDSGKMEIVPVEYDISSLIHDLANMTAQRAKDKNIRLEVNASHEIPSRLYGDDVRIRQILTNILTNAVKYTHEGTIWLRIQYHKNGESAVLKFEVEDTGIGIREEDLPKLSAEFERIEENRNRNIEGTGLGMSITIQLLELMGSRLQVESTYGKGSRFYFELTQKIIDPAPIGDFESRVQQIAENYSYSAKFQAPDARILVVDDNAVNRKVLRNLLKETQIQVTDADSGAECLELVQQEHYDLIFLDHMMPEMDGIETLRHMKDLSHYPCQDTPVVVLTANAISGAKEKYLAEGFDDFLSKPVVPGKLENIIRKMLPVELLQESAAGQTKTAPPNEEPAGAPEEFLKNLPQVDGLDWDYAWLHLPEAELLEYTVKEFYAQIDPAADKLELACGQITDPKQLEQYRIQVHAMKSLAAAIGIMPLSGLAKLLEYAARDGKTDLILSVTPSFLEEWRSYRQKLQGVFGIGPVTRKEVTDYSVLQALIEMLRLSVQEMDIDQADQLAGQLLEYEYPDEISQNIRKLTEAVTNLDIEETDRLASLLIRQMQNH